MKARRALDRSFRQRGFRYASPCYVRPRAGSPLREAWLLNEDDGSLTAQLMVLYPHGEAGLVISPPETEYLYADGQLSCVPSPAEQAGTWPIGSESALIATLCDAGARYADLLCDPAVMVDVYGWLLGVEGTRCPDGLPELRMPWIAQKVTPHRLRARAAYLNVLSRFDEAQAMLAQLPPRQLSGEDWKLLGDAAAGEVRSADLAAHPPLQRVGARSRRTHARTSEGGS